MNVSTVPSSNLNKIKVWSSGWSFLRQVLLWKSIQNMLNKLGDKLYNLPQSPTRGTCHYSQGYRQRKFHSVFGHSHPRETTEKLLHSSSSSLLPWGIQRSPHYELRSEPIWGAQWQSRYYSCRKSLAFKLKNLREQLLGISFLPWDAQ